MKIVSKPYGKLPDGRPVILFHLSDEKGLSFDLINYGGIITSLNVPDRNGKSEDVIIGFDDLSGFLQDTSYINALIGRVGNRIGGSQFEIDGIRYQLAPNEGKNHLHGGIHAFHRILWDAEPFEAKDEAGVKLSYFSKDMEEGYPGNLKVEVKIFLTAKKEIRILYKAETDKATHVNLTHHGYFNLNGGKKDIRDHILKLSASQYTEFDSEKIATGKILPVKGTDLDFTIPHSVGERIDHIGGYDHNFVIDKKAGETALAAEVYEPGSGRVMKVFTDQPGVQFYSSTHFDGSVTGKNGKKHSKYYAFCLETQHFPNTPNRPQFPSTLIRPGEVYQQTAVFKFETR
jgi:aldose 1-epimerase